MFHGARQIPGDRLQIRSSLRFRPPRPCASRMCKPYLHIKNFQTARHHRCAVTCLSVDASGSYIISCANDFKVSLFGIGCDEYNQVLELKFSARSVAIAEDFSRQGSGQRFVTGERSLIMYERGIFGVRSQTVRNFGGKSF